MVGRPRLQISDGRRTQLAWFAWREAGQWDQGAHGWLGGCPPLNIPFLRPPPRHTPLHPELNITKSMGHPLLPAVATIQVQPSSPSCGVPERIAQPPLLARPFDCSGVCCETKQAGRKRTRLHEVPTRRRIRLPANPAPATWCASPPPISKCKAAVDSARCIRCYCRLLVPPGPLAPSAPSVDDRLCSPRRRHPQHPNIASHATHSENTPPSRVSLNPTGVHCLGSGLGTSSRPLRWEFPTTSLYLGTTE